MELQYLPILTKWRQVNGISITEFYSQFENNIDISLICRFFVSNTYIAQYLLE